MTPETPDRNDADLGSCSLRERKKQETRQAIYEAAFNLIYELGPENATVQQICETAGVSERTFFNYYPTKIAAAFGLEAVTEYEEAAEEFVSGTGSVIADACHMVAQIVPLPADKRKAKQLVERYPDVLQEWWGYARELREQSLRALRVRIGDGQRTFLVGGLLMSAFFYVSHTGSAKSKRELELMLRSAITEIGAEIADFNASEQAGVNGQPGANAE